MNNYYELLGVNFDASLSDIEKAYNIYKLENNILDPLITQSYKTLSNSASRLSYNRVLNNFENSFNEEDKTENRIFNETIKNSSIHEYRISSNKKLMSTSNYFYTHQAKLLKPILYSLFYLVLIISYFTFLYVFEYKDNISNISKPLLSFLPNILFMSFLIATWFTYLANKKLFIIVLIAPILYNALVYGIYNSVPYALISILYIILNIMLFKLNQKSQNFGYHQTSSKKIPFIKPRTQYHSKKQHYSEDTLSRNMRELTKIPGTMVYKNVAILNQEKNIINYIITNGEMVMLINVLNSPMGGHYGIRKVNGILSLINSNTGVETNIGHLANLAKLPDNFLKTPYIMRNYLLLENANSEPFKLNNSDSFMQLVDMNKLFNEIFEWFAINAHGGINYTNHRRLFKKTMKR